MTASGKGSGAVATVVLMAVSTRPMFLSLAKNGGVAAVTLWTIFMAFCFDD
jgi:hypothetical protein